jgi:hypothetical protein
MGLSVGEMSSTLPAVGGQNIMYVLYSISTEFCPVVNMHSSAGTV